MEIAVCIPTYNEESAIDAVVSDFKSVLPTALIYVYDNNSTDKTVEIAASAGAVVRKEAKQGKGYVVKRMLADIEADIYVIVDGDNTYDHKAASVLIKSLIEDNLDMVVATRLINQTQFRKGHYTGNLIFSKLVSFLFSAEIKDVMSGYRVLSRRLVKSFPVSSKGFEIESEMTIHCLELGLPFREVNANFKNRDDQSESKLNTVSDGFRILAKIILLLKSTRPFLFFSFWALVALLSGAVLLLPVLVDYFNTGLVPRFPSLIVSVGFFILGLISFVCGVVLDSVAAGQTEMKKLFYLNHKSTTSQF